MAGWKGRGKDGRSVTECKGVANIEGVWQGWKGHGKDGKGVARWKGCMWLYRRRGDASCSVLQ